ncbi:hypothetical protein FGIG_05155 [Fasciola gigantica]|uniref:Uncharacterized protein n=1 Tax=Fasciola gigantica TaxID=46835 RepID=A0A504YR99_FASGI|nr:hypothetical protein FGIG_05155 [Fasciola gigantica]
MLFLFYEPNFNDPFNASASYPEDGMTMEQTIWKSFHGGFVNSTLYEPNRAWLRWVEDNGIESFDHSLTEKCSEFVVDSVEAVSGFRRYYYLEQCSYDQKQRVNDLDVKSVTVSSFEHCQLKFAGKQSSVFGIWFLRPSETPNDNSETFANQLANDQPEIQVDREGHEDELCSHSSGDYDDDDDTAGVVEQSEEGRRETKTILSEENMVGVATASRADTESTIRESQGSENVASVENSINRDGLSANVARPNAGEVREDDVLSVISSNVNVGYVTDADGTGEDDWQGTLNVEVDREDASSNTDSEEVRYVTDPTYWRQMFQYQEKAASLLWPWWWIMYRSRWPAHLAPHHMTQVRRCRRRYWFARASSVVLWSDLFRLSMRYERTRMHLLVDSLVSFLDFVLIFMI